MIIATRTPWKPVYIAALCSFVQSLQYGLFFASTWPYLKHLDHSVSVSFFGYVIAIYSFGQCVSSPIFGYWSNRIKQVRMPTIFGLSMMLSGNLIYIVMDALPSGHRYAMAASRMLIGIGSGNSVLLRAYASTASISVDRSRAIGCVASGIAVGLVIGPGLQTLFTPLGEEGVHVLFGWSLNMYKAPACLAALINICGISLMYFAFDEKYAGLKEDHEIIKLPSADFIAVTICILTRFTQVSVATNIETLGSEYSMLMFDLSPPEAVKVNSMSQIVQGIAASIILLPFLFLDIESLLGGCDANQFDWCSTLPRVDIWLYYISLCMVFEVTFAMSNVVLPTLFSKIIGPRRQVGGNRRLKRSTRFLSTFNAEYIVAFKCSCCTVWGSTAVLLVLLMLIT
ncbi:transporter, major facilitator family protein [Dictyocaulus viviparus]|uniref:Transporter, major facilitator family protein n=1 Tax=Dictyocaulus viviparus TaxID=29172 RepID=A0A0D8XYZ1_DICVI|nr:transporter, major facilitator family protein [Dictyocaulus viviparus]